MLAAALLTGIAPIPAPPARAAAAGEEELLLLAVFVNGRDIKTVGEFVARDGELSARAGELRALGFAVPAKQDDVLVALHDLPGLTYRYDARRQELHVDVPIEVLAGTTLSPDKVRDLDAIPFSRSTGAVLNYDLLATASEGKLFGSGLWEARGFSPYGVVTTDVLTAADSGGVSLTRLDSVYSFANPDSLSRSSVGDVITGAMPWTRSVRLGGAQYATDFRVRPDLITFPLPDISGQAAVPSTVDVLVNGVPQLRGSLEPGPFEIRQLPVVTGAGNVTVLVTDATGQQTSQTLPFYASSALLAPRLNALSIDVGAVRKNFATSSDHYGRLAGAFSFRYGVSPELTWEAHAEGTSGLASFGTGGVARLGNFGIFSFAGSVSNSGGNTGTAFYASFERATPVYRFGGSALIADGDFRDLAAMNGDPFPRKVLQASAGLSMGEFGSLGAAFTHVERPLRVAVRSSNLRVSTLSATYSKQLTRDAYIYATGLHNFGSNGTSALMVGLSARFGENVSATAGADFGDNGVGLHAGISHSAIDVGDVGWQAYGRYGDSDRALAAVQYKSPWALVSGAVDAEPGSVAARAGAVGAVAFLRGRIMPTNRITDSFALVETGGIAGVKVLRENRYAGETDSHGQLLIPDLRSFEANKITIDPSGLPLDADLHSTSMFVRPHDRSGALARFNITQQHSALIKLADAQGKPLALGATAVLDATGAKLPVGYDGLVYATGVVEKNTLTVTLPDDKGCVASFDFTPAPGTVPEVGPLTCRETRVAP